MLWLSLGKVLLLLRNAQQGQCAARVNCDVGKVHKAASRRLYRLALRGIYGRGQVSGDTQWKI
jgi:hypothetical protein